MNGRGAKDELDGLETANEINWKMTTKLNNFLIEGIFSNFSCDLNKFDTLILVHSTTEIILLGFVGSITC